MCGKVQVVSVGGNLGAFGGYTYDSHCVVWAVRSGGCSRAPPTGVGRLKLPGCGFESSSQRCGKHDGDVWEQKHHQRMHGVSAEMGAARVGRAETEVGLQVAPAAVTRATCSWGPHGAPRVNRRGTMNTSGPWMMATRQCKLLSGSYSYS